MFWKRKSISKPPAMKTIGIFPASGALGSSNYTHLLSQVPHDKVILISRYPEKTPQAHRDKGVHLRQASYESTPEELEAAFAGIDVLFLISYPSHVHEYRTKVQLPALNSVHRAGVRHVFYSSLGFAGPEANDTKAEVMRAHLDTESHLQMLGAVDEGFTWTIVREGLYSESTGIYTAFFALDDPTDEIRIPHDGSGPGVSWVKRDELGEATANLIAQYAQHPESFKWKNQIVTLTGSREWSLADTVAAIAKAIGKDVKIQPVSVDEYVTQPKVLKVFGSEEKARTWATAWAAIQAGETAYVSPALEEILGRKPEEFEVTIGALARQKQHAA